MSAVTAWVQPPDNITGRDHLGVRVPCEILYARLIPGITNVTNRARYYSFYPWLIWAFGQRYKSLSGSEFVEKLRRADCLLTLIGAWHGGEPEKSWRHGGDLVGRSVLLNVLKDWRRGEDKACRLSNYTRQDSSERYFKNKLGGLGQYYFGPLRELGVLEGDAKSHVKYTRERGGILAEALDEGVNLKKFFDAIEEDKVTVSMLKSLKAFCPCGLTSNAGEQNALVDLFFNRPGVFFDENGQARRQTLTLLLDFVAQLESIPDGCDQEVSNEWLFRASAYTGALPGGKTWAAPSALEPIRRGWMVYQRNELLSVALQGIFWAALDGLKKQDDSIESRQAFGDWFVSSFAEPVLGNKLGETFAAAVDRLINRMPRLADWIDGAHEIQLAWRLVDDAQPNADTKARERVVHLAIDILLALAARRANETDPYEGFVGPAELTDYPINLFTFQERSRGAWREVRLAGLLSWLVTEWGLDVHFRVALRKLRGESNDTFRIRPTDEGLEVIGAPPPEFSNPRLRQSFHILCDLGAMERDQESGLLSLTDLGRSLLEECRG